MIVSGADTAVAYWYTVLEAIKQSGKVGDCTTYNERRGTAVFSLVWWRTARWVPPAVFSRGCRGAFVVCDELLVLLLYYYYCCTALRRVAAVLLADSIIV